MSKDVEVIFSEEKKGQFKIGQRKKVKLGYAQNYLFPQKLAIMVSHENENHIQTVQTKATAHHEHLKENAQDVKSKIDGQTITAVHKVHDDIKLYGSVSTQDIAQMLNDTLNVTVDRYDIRLPQPIKTVGVYTVDVVIHEEIKITINVDVQAEAVKEDNKNKKKKTTRNKKDQDKQEKS